MQSVEEIRNKITNIHFEVYFLCVREIEVPDGAQLCLLWLRGQNVVESSVKLAMQQRAYF